MRKLRNHPALREYWRKYLRGELEEQYSPLTPVEIRALYDMDRRAQPKKRNVIQKIVRFVKGW